jgi:GT2 family glycosyltransferase
MIISFCIPNMNRTHDLRKTLPYAIVAANESPPVEILVLDYDSKDGLVQFLQETSDNEFLETGNVLTYAKSAPHEYFSISHARNCAAKASKGDYLAILDADIALQIDFVEVVRALIDKEQPAWMVESRNGLGRLPIVRRDEFMNAGGYDERFNVCGPEDKDICARLKRRGGKFVAYPDLTFEIPTPYRMKFANVDARPYAGMGQIKREMSRAMRVYYEENNTRGVLVANEGKEWGAL